MMHNYFDKPIDITAEKEIRSLFTFGYNGEWYNLSQAILWLGNRLRNSQGDYIVLYHTNVNESETILAEGTDLFCDFFLELTPAVFKSLGQLYAYNRDKNETYVVRGDGVLNVDGIYKFFTEKGKTI